RGGIEVAYDTIKRYNFEWDLIIPRKIGAPDNKEVAVGAVSVDRSYIINEYFVKALKISNKYLAQEINDEINEIKRRLKKYRGTETLPDVKDKTVILIDDGIATGFTLTAAIKSIKNLGAIKIVLAVPVGPKHTVKQFKEIVDEVICIYSPDDFTSVGRYYEDFSQVEDEEVFNLLDKLRGK
ncbi:MAG TPA: phosphoribosyltransferase family protein, partial [Peptostreptococcaceae bacterium]|nr:phosphoribosyltransferase family protein [Peptostreptococcaceae bacterium]